ncbi:MAG: class B sortase, partial [Clostridia bacterium]|nr:class B sortase [Clostridia bacterium]
VVTVTISMFIRILVQRNNTVQESAATTIATQSQASPALTPTPSPTPQPTPTPIPYRVSDRLAEVRAQNPDAVAWLTIPGTRIDDPVVCGTDNDFYLKHDYLGNKDIAGAIYQDFRNAGSFSGRHSILYGHNMKDGSMFHNLRYFKEEDFARENGRIVLETLDGMTEWQIFASYVTTTDFYVIQTAFSDDTAYQAFLDTVIEKSDFDYGVDVTASQQILTLLTCSYEVEDARFVVHAVKLQ